MAIGVSTACFYPLETEEALREVGEIGAAVTEIFLNTERELKPAFIDILKNISLYYGAKVKSLHTFTAASDAYIYYSNYPRRFEDGLDLIRRFSYAAAELGAEYLIMHGDKLPGKLPDEEVAEHFMIMESAANEFGVCILQENVNRFRSADPEFIRSMRALTDNKMNFCLDIKQALRSGHTPEEMIEAMGENIRHIHISDNSSKADCLLPGDGAYDFGALFRRMKGLSYSGDYIIEVYNNCYKSAKEVQKSLNSTILYL